MLAQEVPDDLVAVDLGGGRPEDGGTGLGEAAARPGVTAAVDLVEHHVGAVTTGPVGDLRDRGRDLRLDGRRLTAVPRRPRRGGRLRLFVLDVVHLAAERGARPNTLAAYRTDLDDFESYLAATGARVRSLPLWKDPQVKWHGAP